MLLRVLLCLSVTYIAGCTTNRTKYQPMYRSEGYAVKQDKNNISISRFSGNALIRKADAKLFSVFRAVEYCYESGHNLTRLFETVDRTKSEIVQKSSQSTYQTPVFQSGTKSSN